MTIAPSASSATQAVPQSTSFRVAAGVLVGKAPGKVQFVCCANIHAVAPINDRLINARLHLVKVPVLCELGALVTTLAMPESARNG